MRKTRQTRGWRVVVLSLLVVGVLAVIGLALARHFFSIRQLMIIGNDDVPAQEVAAMSGIRLGQRMQAIDEARVSKAIENDGRLAFVSLERDYPGGMILTVRRRTIDAVTLQSGNVLGLDSEGYVVDVMDRLPEVRPPYVTGLQPGKYVKGRQLDTTDGRISTMSYILQALKASGATAYITEINLESLNDIRLLTRHGTVVLLGDRQNIADKITWLAGAVNDIEARGEVGGQLDVSSGSKADYKPLTQTVVITSADQTTSTVDDAAASTEASTTEAGG